MGYTSSLSHFSYNDWGGLSLSAKDALPPGSEDFFPPASPDGTVGNLRKSKISALGIAFMLFCLVSAGAFGIEEIIPSAGPGPHSYHSDRAALRLGAPISRLVAEANAILPREGGIYAWAKETFGEFWGFQAGWWTSMDTYISSAPTSPWSVATPRSCSRWTMPAPSA